MLNNLTLLAIIPGLVLIVLVYKFDRIEKEPVSEIFRFVKYGIFTTFAAAALEAIGSLFLDSLMDDCLLKNILMYFVIVAGAEEGMKYYVFNKYAWSNWNFNYKFDAIVYSVSIGMGFAIWENIQYVYRYGYNTGVARAFTAVPGHATFAIIMGCFLGKARKEANYAYGYDNHTKLYKRLALIIPMLVHGLYDFLLTSETMASEVIFLVLLMFMYWISYVILGRCSKDDEYIGV